MTPTATPTTIPVSNAARRIAGREGSGEPGEGPEQPEDERELGVVAAKQVSGRVVDRRHPARLAEAAVEALGGGNRGGRG
jgi:hypothetical protein